MSSPDRLRAERAPRWKVPNIVLDAILLVANGSLHPRVEHSSATAPSAATPRDAARNAGAASSGRPTVARGATSKASRRSVYRRKLAKLRRDPERFFRDSKWRAVRAIGRVVLRGG